MIHTLDELGEILIPAATVALVGLVLILIYSLIARAIPKEPS